MPLRRAEALNISPFTYMVVEAAQALMVAGDKQNTSAAVVAAGNSASSVFA